MSVVASVPLADVEGAIEDAAPSARRSNGRVGRVGDWGSEGRVNLGMGGSAIGGGGAARTRADGLFVDMLAGRGNAVELP